MIYFKMFKVTFCFKSVPFFVKNVIKFKFRNVAYKISSIYEATNFDDYFQDFSAVKNSVSKRDLNLNIDELKDYYETFMKLLKKKNELETQKEENASKMKEIAKHSKSKLLYNTDNLKQEGRIIRNKLKEITTLDGEHGLKDLKSKMLPLLKRLPAKLHPDTPAEDKVEFESEISENGLSNKLLNHIKLCGTHLQLRTHELSTNNLQLAYMTGSLALLEYKLYFKLLNELSNLKGYKQIVCADMVKEFVVDYCAESLDDKGIKVMNPTQDLSIIQNHPVLISPNMYLVGTSMPSFVGFLSSYEYKASSLPLNFYSFGRNYKSSSDGIYGLYDLSQTMQADLYSVSNECSYASFEEQKSYITSFYKSLGLPFKIMDVGVLNLSTIQSRRCDFYIWSPGFKKYFKTGYVKCHDDHISRRLSLKCPHTNKFMHMTHGVVFKLQTLIASLIEHSQTNENFTKLLSKVTLEMKQKHGNKEETSG